MRCSFAHRIGVLSLNVRIPNDLAPRVRVTPPVADALVIVVVTDKVFLSLGTKDGASAVR